MRSVCMICAYDTLRGFVELKKIQKSEKKPRKWVGGSSPNSDLVFFFGKFVFFVLFFDVVSKKN